MRPSLPLLSCSKHTSKQLSHLISESYTKSQASIKKSLFPIQLQKSPLKSEELQNTEKWRQFHLVHLNRDASNNNCNKKSTRRTLNFHDFNKRKSWNFKVKVALCPQFTLLWLTFADYMVGNNSYFSKIDLGSPALRLKENWTRISPWALTGCELRQLTQLLCDSSSMQMDMYYHLSSS